MRRTLSAAVLTLAALALPTDAPAGSLWAILEEFSGPGPFKGSNFVFTGCQVGGRLQASPLLPTGSRKPLWCFHYERGDFDDEADQGFPDIEINLHEVGAGARLTNYLDVGMSLGWMTFITDDTRRLPVITPLRANFRPLLLIPNPRKWYGVVGVYVKTPWVFGEINGTHFGGAAAAFQSDGEFIPSYGLAIDLTSLIPDWRR